VKFIRIGIVTVVVAALFSGAWIQPAWAIKAFQKQFWAKYLDNNADQDFATIVKKQVKCNICHDPTRKTPTGKSSKKFRNAYGQQLSKLLNRKKDKKNIGKIQKALETVAKLSSNPSDPASPTYGERIKQKKLPVGELPTKK